MPETAARIAADLVRLRMGYGPEGRRQDLRQRLMAIDPRLRRQRNVERLRLAQLEHQLRATDTRQHPGAFRALQEAAEQSAKRLAVLDGRIAEALSKGEAAPVVKMALAPRQQDPPPDPVMVQQAQAILRGRLWVASALLGGLPLPARLVDQLQAAVAREIERLAP